MKHIGIIGLGLIGGSIARTLKRRPEAVHITVMSRNEEALAAALSDGAADVVTTADWSLFADCGVVFICVPVSNIADCAQNLAAVVRRDCVVTDVGSVKSAVVREMAALDICFVGGHPMAGSEKSGYAAAADYLFENAYYILTPTAQTPAFALERLQDLAKDLGAIPVVLDADYHDKVVAAISHGPHIVAAALVNAVSSLDAGRGDMQALAAGGFKDITRIASSDGSLWQGICMENREEVLRFVRSFQAETEAFLTALESEDGGEVRNLFESARDYRSGFAGSTRAKYAESFIVHLDVLDKPGSIATVATLLSVNNINIKNIGIVHNREYHDGVLQIVLDSAEGRARAVDLLKSMSFTVYE